MSWNHRQKLPTRQRRSMLLPVALIAWILCGVGGCSTDNPPDPLDSFVLGDSDYLLDCDPSGKDESALACQLAYYANRERQANQEESDQAESLDWNGDLAVVAQNYTERMCNEGFFDHVDPQGRRMEDRLQDAGIFYVKAGENLARGKNLSPSDAMDMFMNEPSCYENHRGIVLDNDFTDTGVGTVFCGDTIIYTQLFAAFDSDDLRTDPNEYCRNH